MLFFHKPEYQKNLKDALKNLSDLEATELKEAKRNLVHKHLREQHAKTFSSAFSFLKDLQSLTHLSGEQQQQLLNQTRILPDGSKISLMFPNITSENINPIIQNLDQLVRFGGSAQIKFKDQTLVYSVANHLILGAKILENVFTEGDLSHEEYAEYLRYWLAHDLQEGSMGLDMPNPYKQTLTLLAGFDIWAELEDHHSKAIHKFLGLNYPLPKKTAKVVKSLDIICLLIEAKQLFNLDLAPEFPKFVFKDIKDAFPSFHSSNAPKLTECYTDLNEILAKAFPDIIIQNMRAAS